MTRMPATSKRDLTTFVVIAYAITWALWIPSLAYSASTGWAIPSITQGFSTWSGLSGLRLLLALSFQLAVYGPAVAALALFALRGDRAGRASWVQALLRFRVGRGWYAFVLLAPVALAVLVAGVGLSTGGALVAAAWPSAGILATMVVTQILTSGFEEPGWRGYALPLLQKTHSAENASWYLGLIWAGWHLPYMLYLYRGLPSWQVPLTLAGFTMSIVAMGYVHAWVRNSTGSTALNVLLHGWSNVTNALVAAIVVSPLVPLATAGVTWLFVAWLFRRYGKQTLSAS